MTVKPVVPKLALHALAQPQPQPPAPATGPPQPRRVLSNVSLRDLLAEQPPGRRIVTLRHDDSIAHALSVLAESNIIAAPVMVSPLRSRHAGAEDSEDSDSGHGSDTMVGWADVRDILRAFVTTHAEKLAGVCDPGGWDAALDAVAADFVNRKLITVVGEDGGLLPSLSQDMSLLDAVTEGFLSTGGLERTLTPRSRGAQPPPQQQQQQQAPPGAAPAPAPARGGGGSVVHRLALFRGGALSAVLSQSDCMAYLHTHGGELLGPLAGATLAQLGLLSGRAVVCVSPGTPTHAAFRAMFESGVGAVGVADPHTGALVANLSASDLRRLRPDSFRLLALPVTQFLARLAFGHHASSVGGGLGGGGAAEAADAASLARAAAGGVVPFAGAAVSPSSFAPVHAPVSVTPGTALGRLLELLGASRPRVHRVYICDANSVPVGVVTATDVLRVLAALEAPPPPPPQAAEEEGGGYDGNGDGEGYS